MKRIFTIAVAAIALTIANLPAARADGLIHQLPADGSWVQFDMTGEGVRPNGQVSVKIKGTVTVKSVGREPVDGADCRWIELEMVMEGERGGGQPEGRTSFIKLLIPEKHLAAGQNPLDHVKKAWKKEGKDGNSVALDLTGNGAPEVKRMDELLNAGIASSEKKGDVEISVPAGKFRCTHLKGQESQAGGAVDVEIQTWLANDVPFGVAAYRHSKMRKSNGQSQGGRSMELKLSKSGTGAKSAIAN
ncbi:MAG: hypothetical protein HY290_30940 [Planctomycetia bacterium]|nr:hypothetical protein [Planctomycetia bacterium]